MKVLIIGHGDFYSGGKTAAIMEILLASGHEVERVKIEDIPPKTYDFQITGIIDECREYQREAIKEIIGSIREREVLKIKNNPGPRDRWGKVK